MQPAERLESIGPPGIQEELAQPKPDDPARQPEGTMEQPAPSEPARVLEEQPMLYKPSRGLEDVALEIHSLCRLHEITIIERHTAWIAGAAREDSARLLTLCEELLEFAMHTSGSEDSQITALKTICALSIEDPCIRKAFGKSEESHRRLQDLTSDETGQQISKWASVALDAVVNKEVHDYWTDAITDPLFKEKVQQLKKGAPGASDIGEPDLASPEHWKPSILYIAIAEKLAVGGPSERQVLNIDRHIRRLQRRNADVLKIQLLCKKLFKFASHPQTAVATVKAVLALTVQGLFLREAFEGQTLTDNPYLQDMTKNLQSEDHIWASILSYAFNHHEELNKRWLEKAAAPSVLAKNLSERILSSTSESSELADLYFDLAGKLNATGPIDDDETNLGNMERDLVISGCATKASKKCDKCGKIHKIYLKPSKELLEHVLKTATSGSLPDLSSIDPRAMNQAGGIGAGGFADVFKVSIPNGSKAVAIKLLRLDYQDEKFIACNGSFVLRNFARELRVLARLDHPNVLKLLGFSKQDQQYFFAFEFMEKGDLKMYMDSGEGTMRDLFIMSLGIAKGVCYLHSSKINVVHGDLKTLNVLVSSSGEPVLADFGLSRMAESLVSKGYYSTVISRASLPWVPHEFYHMDDKAEVFRPTQKSDVWAFGMTLLELLTGDIPYAHINNEGGITKAIIDGRLPQKPKFDLWDPDAQLKEDIWELCLRCWILPAERPFMREVEQNLIRIKYRNGISVE